MEHKILLSGQWQDSPHPLGIKNPYTEEIVFHTFQASVEQIKQVIKDQTRASQVMKGLALWKKADILEKIIIGLQTRATEIAECIRIEAGKPIQYAIQEVERAIQTFKLAYAASLQSSGELLSLDVRPGLEGKKGLVKKFPIGPILAISPFNFPLNLVAHKVAPAIAVGNPIVLKAASKTPITSLILAEIILEAGFPPEALSVVPCNRDNGQLFVESDVFKLLSFTGSPEVGWYLKSRAGNKKVILELGGDAAALVSADADLAVAAKKCAIGAFAYAGQICISIQRIIVEKAVYKEFRDLLIQETESIMVGDTALADTVCGPVISRTHQRRIMEWTMEAEKRGAHRLIGGKTLGNNIVAPTILENTPKNCKFGQEEAFAPVVSLIQADNWEEAIHLANDTKFGLQAGIFTKNEKNIQMAFELLDVGGVIVNEAPTLRVDSMPYGGIKDSGLGREGVLYAMEDMTEPKILVW